MARVKEDLPGVGVRAMRRPGRSALVVLERIRLDPDGLPVVGVSGHCSQHDRDSAEDLGVLAFHPKPLQFRELLATIAPLRGRRG